ncbi:Hypothetical protein SCLAV_1109 [Streptomyces clavuligerus]|uniref:Uncharacterized protein n=1 Tax=Streptomyces clavuligerus TaxID=1901 RepID=E2PYG6_STRCL|nr:Hypothetical protein SCLAV_1109 [Streptomyces clavuligerus]
MNRRLRHCAVLILLGLGYLCVAWDPPPLQPPTV